MRSRAACAIMALLVCGCNSSARMIYLPEPDQESMLMPEVDWKVLRDRFPGAEGVYLSVEHSIEHAGGELEGWTNHNLMRRTYVVFEPEVEWLTTLELHSRPKKLFMKVRTPEGEERRYGLEDLEQDVEGEGQWVFVYPDIRPGTVIEEAIEHSWPGGPIDYNIPLEFGIPCEKLSFRFAYPEWWKVHVKRQADGTLPAYREEHDTLYHKSIMIYQDSGIAAVKPEPYSPYLRETMRYLDFQVVYLKMGQSASYKAPSDWNDFGESMSNVVQRPVRKLSPAFVRRLDSAVAFDLPAIGATPLDSVRSLVHFVQKKVEMTPNVGNVNTDYEQVLRERKGDLFDVTGLLDFALGHFGFFSDYLLVHSAKDGYFDREYINWSQISTVALRVTRDRSEWIIFPHRTDLPFGFIPPDLLGQPAIIVDRGWNDRMTHLPDSQRVETKSRIELQAHIDSSGAVAVHERRELFGTMAWMVRDSLEHLSHDELQVTLRTSLVQADRDVQLDSFSVQPLKEPERPLEVVLHYHVSNVVTLLPREVIVQAGWLLTPVSFDCDRADSSRRNPVRVPFAQEHFRSVSLTFPPAWEIAGCPEDATEASDFGSLSVTSQCASGSLQMEQALSLNRVQRPAEDVSRLWQLLGCGAASASKPIVLARGVSP